MMTIRSEQCTTCIYRPDSPLGDNLPVLEDEIRDPRAPYPTLRKPARATRSRGRTETRSAPGSPLRSASLPCCC